MPTQWTAAVTSWRERADRHWTVAPDRVIEYTLWQTLVGAWQLPLERAKSYALKAAREARLRTSWRRNDADYEAALVRWLEGSLGLRASNPVLKRDIDIGENKGRAGENMNREPTERYCPGRFP